MKYSTKDGLTIIAGPCVIETKEMVFETAQRLKEICQKLQLPFIFKSSYDKANRTSVKSYRGPGSEEGLKILEDVKNRLSVPVLTDVHSPEEAVRAAEIVDVLQIPAFLCRQTDLIMAASETGKRVNVKKGQFLAPRDMKNIIDKFTSTGNTNLMITERGTSFGYNNLIVDFRAFPIMRSFGYPVIFDVTHSLQLPGGEGSCSGGQREFAESLARAAVSVGVDGLFMEVHPEPDMALCDGPNMIPIKEVEGLLKRLKEIYQVIKRFNENEIIK
ncbi:MAG: 3-deoxy-8-phosphooctulonate synthase [Nitrospinota bacterium]